MTPFRAIKDPQEVVDFSIDWSATLGADDTIATSAWAVGSGGVTIDSESETTTVTTVWLSGGTVGTGEVTNTVVTTNGRTYERTIYLTIAQK